MKIIIIMIIIITITIIIIIVIIMISGGKKRTSNCLMLTRSAEADYAELCSLDVLGLKEDTSNKDNDIYQQFKDQL